MSDLIVMCVQKEERIKAKKIVNHVSSPIREIFKGILSLRRNCILPRDPTGQCKRCPMHLLLLLLLLKNLRMMDAISATRRDITREIALVF